MLKVNNFFQGHSINLKRYSYNTKKTKFFFNMFVKELKMNKIPLLESYEKIYEYDFSNTDIKKFFKYKNIIIVGIGGSSLGAKSIYSFFKNKIKKKVFFFDNLDLNLHDEYKKIKDLKNSCFIVISKSGNTLETLVNLNIIFSKKIIKNNLIIVTEIKDSALMNIARKYRATVIEHKNYIGGRYSVLSETGMLPAALMGLKISKFKDLNKLIKNRNFVNCLIKNVATIYSLNLKKINNSVILNYNSKLNDLGYWYQQLVAESLGKKGKGINPILSFGPKFHHSLLQLYLDGPKDKFFTFFDIREKEKDKKIKNSMIVEETKFLRSKNLKAVVNAQFKAVQSAFKAKKIPFRQIVFKKINEESLGEVFTFFVLETILLSYLMNINPYNEPAVETVKIKTKKYLL